MPASASGVRSLVWHRYISLQHLINRLYYSDIGKCVCCIKNYAIILTHRKMSV